MDQKITAAGTMVSAVLLFFCGFIVGGLGLGMLFSYPDQIWWLGLVMVVSAVFITIGGISNVKMSRRMDKEADEDMKIVQQQLRQIRTQVKPAASGAQTSVTTVSKATEASLPTPDPNSGTSPIILAHWKYSKEEWKQFIAWETRKRKSNTKIEALIILILGGLLLMWNGAGFLLSFVISGLFATFYWFVKIFLSNASIGTSGKNEVVITQYAVIINGKYNAFVSEMYWLRDVRIIEEASIKVLEIEYEWQTRKGKTFDEIRVPVPPSKLNEAKWLMKVLKGL